MKGISKWVETAMRPVPERSHILNTWPTKAGPPPLRLELSPAILTDDGNGDVDADAELDSGGDETPPPTADLEGPGSGRDDSKASGLGESGMGRGKQSREGDKEEEEEEDGVVLAAAVGLKTERRLEVVEWRMWEMGLFL
ncbi:hypothetical protein TIFTF001_013709 [Ficus carica]|uniref:Uncharacterized protein n=1 Tax=Ficus carica TaxID=3494 RepID=A0AA88A3Y9_FICCA|nr:hypothetical protein TIFTF001_013709 [Ficus carica]